MQEKPQVFLDGQAFNVSSYDKSDQAIFGPRFGEGAESETDLTLLKSISFRPLDHGSFTRKKSADLTPYIVNGSPDYLKNILTNPLPPESIDVSSVDNDLGTTAINEITAKTVWRGDTYFATRLKNVNSIHKYDYSTHTLTQLTIPSTLSTSVTAITSFAEHLGVLFVCMTSTSGLHYISTGGTVTKTTTGSFTYKQIFNLNSRMYAVNSDNKVFEYVATALATMLQTLVCQLWFNYLGADTTAYKNDSLNGRQYFVFPDGVYCFDGVSAYVVIPAKGLTANAVGLGFAITAGGAFYYRDGRYLMRFNGASVEKLYQLPVYTYFTNATALFDVLYFSTRKYEDDEISEKIDSTDPSFDSGARVYSFDGINLYLVADIDYPALTGKAQGYTYLLPSLGGPILANSYSGSASYVSELLLDRLTINFDRLNPVTSDQTFFVVFQKEDMGLPSVEKQPREAQFNFSKELDQGAGAEINVYCRTSETDAWELIKHWQTGTDDMTTNFFRSVLDTYPEPARSYYFKVEIDGEDFELESMQIYYLIKTPMRFQWNLVLEADMAGLDANATYDPNANKIEALRLNNAVTTFEDWSGNGPFDVIVDSFSHKIIPTFTEDSPQARYSLILREV